MVHWLVVGFGGLLGAIAGSYCATILLRWPRGLTATTGRSRCDTCATTLGTMSLVPLFSYLWQRGQCRTCAAAIPVDHVAMESAAALIGGLSAILFAAEPLLALASALFGWCLLLLAALDLRHFWLPDRLTLLLAALGFSANLLNIGPGLPSAAIGAMAGYAGLWLLARAYRAASGREGLGGGDPKLMGAIGAWLGWQLLPWVLWIAAMLGLAAAGLLILLGRRLERSSRLPLGTLLAVAAWPLWLALHLGMI